MVKNPEEWKPEKIVGGDDAKENVVPYGLTEEKLIPGIHYPKTEGSKMNVGNVYIASGTTGSVNVTGVGFAPKIIRVYASGGGTGSNGTSNGYYNGNNFCLYEYFNAGTRVQSNSAYALYVNSAGSDSYGTITSVYIDGFTINMIGSSISINILYECYG